MLKPNLQKLAKKGENLAYQYLTAKGYKIISRNFRSKLGEIDLIALDQNTLVFIEVKTRISKEFGEPEEAVTKYKIRSIEKTGEFFKSKFPHTPNLLRIDVISILLSDGNTPQIKHIENITEKY